MATSKQRRNGVYGLNQPIYQPGPDPVVSNRDPQSSDKLRLMTQWGNKLTGGAWVLTSITAGSATWTPTTVNGGATITTGNLTIVAGDANLTAGDVNLTAGDVNLTAGDVTLDAGDVTATLGSITAGTGFTATTGNITATAGSVEVTLGDVVLTNGDISVVDGTLEVRDVAGGNGTIVADGDIDSAGNIEGVMLFASGDDAGQASTVGFTDVTDTTLSTGAGVVLMKTANPGDSSGWLKIYVGTDVRYIPFWTNLSP